MAVASKTRITYRQGKGYSRDLGWKLSPDGRRVQPRFLLGHDQRAAELANLRLEGLWQKVVEQTARRNTAAESSFDGEPPEEPLWDGFTLRIADAIRRGQPAVKVPRPTPDDVGGGPVDDGAYATWVHDLQAEFGNLIAFIPEDQQAIQRGQEQHLQVAHHRARQARRNAAIAKAPIPQTGIDQTMYQAFDAYAHYAGETGKGGSNEPKDTRSLKDAIKDMTLDGLNYDAIQRIGDYWRSRPVTRRHGGKGKPIALNTVRNKLKTARRLIRWLHRSNAWTWRAPDDWEHALKMDEKRLMTEEELLASADGPPTWMIDELAMISRYATDRERVLILLGLNLGFAQSECISFRKTDIKLDATPPHVRRVRRKTAKPFAASLWPETIRALQWTDSERQKVEPKGNPWVLLTERGERPSTQHIANVWNRLIARIRKDHPEFRFLPFKMLRKTAFQLVLEASGSMEVAGTFEARGQLSSDEQADKYGRRLFELVFAALDKVHDRLQPMFAAAPANAFTTERSKGSPNLSRGRIEQIQRLHAEGVSIAEIVRITGVSRATCYRWIERAEPAACG